MDSLKPDYLELNHATKHVRLDPTDLSFVQDPYLAYQFLHHFAPSFFWEDYGFWCFSRFEDVNRLLRDRRFGRQKVTGSGQIREGLADFDAVEAHSMLELEPPAHTRLRTLVNRAFVSRQIERLRPEVEQLAHSLIDNFLAAGSAELIRDFAEPIPISIITGILGLPAADGRQLLKWSHAMVAMYMHGTSREGRLAANRAAAEFSSYLAAEINKKRKAPGDDLLSLLISQRDQGESLSEDELISSTILLLNAGHEATVHQIGNAIVTILGQKKAPASFFSDPASSVSTVDECLRINPPLHLFTRYAYERIELSAGLAVERGEKIGLLLGAANHDPTVFQDPSRFCAERKDQKNVSFGAGIHFCIGAPLARLELQIALKVLFNRLPGLKFTAAPRYRDIYHFHGVERLDVIW